MTDLATTRYCLILLDHSLRSHRSPVLDNLPGEVGYLTFPPVKGVLALVRLSWASTYSVLSTVLNKNTSGQEGKPEWSEVDRK